MGLHSGLAWVANAPEFEMDAMEARALAKATKDLLDYYPDQMRWLDGRTGAWIGFSQTALVIYGSKLTALRMRRSTARQPASQGPRVVPIRSVQEPRAEPVAVRQPEQSPINGQGAGIANEDQSPVPADIRTGNIPGVGEIEFPTDHPLFRKH